MILIASLTQIFLLLAAQASDSFEAVCQKAGGTPHDINCECDITYWKINPYNSKCPEKEIAQDAQKLPNLGLQLTGQEADCKESHAFSAPKNMPDIGSCLAFKRDDEMEFLRQNWGLEASGAELLREHPGVKTADYENARLGIVDTGLAVKGNPDAGALLQGDSPEKEYGAHVAGIAVSEKYGVNPYLRAKIFPTLHTSGMAGGFEGTALINSFAQAIDDPQMKVINVSIGSSVDNPNLIRLLNEAQTKGKWVVLAGGNEGSVNGNKMLGQQKKQENLFVIGSLSYFSAPSNFSNFGAETDYYSPGSAITSLNATYVSEPQDNKPSIHYGGTSMATPHFAAVLATMRALYPPLDLDSAKYILEKTAIFRGGAKKIKQANDYHALHLLWMSKACLEQKKSESKSCIDQAEEQIQNTLKVPELPKTSDCPSWEKYYADLKRSFFLSNGSDKYASPIQDVLSAEKDPSWLEKTYLSSNDRLPSVLSRYRVPGNLEKTTKESLAALDFYFPSENSKAQTVLGSALSILEAKPENVPRFVELCKDYLTGDLPPATMPNKDQIERISDLESNCRAFVDIASPLFIKALVERIRSDKIPITNDNTRTNIIVNYAGKLAQRDQDRFLALRDELEHDLDVILLSNNESKLDWKAYGQMLSLHGRYFSIQEKVEFAKKYAALRSGHNCQTEDENGQKTEGFCYYDADILGLAPPSYFKDAEEKKRFVNMLDPRPLIAQASYALDQAIAGHASNEEALRLLDMILKDPSEYLPDMTHDVFSERLVQFAESPDGALELAKRLAKDDNLVRLSKVTSAVFVVERLIARVSDADLRKKLIDAALRSKSIYADTKSIYVSTGNPVEVALSSKTPEAQAKIDELLKNKQKNHWLEKIRLGLIQKRIQDKGATEEELLSFANESKKAGFPFRSSSFKLDLITHSDVLMKHLENELKTEEDADKLNYYWDLIRFADPTSYAKLLPLLAENFKFFLENPGIGTFSWVIEEFPEHKIPDPKIVKKIIDSLEEAIKPDLKYFDNLGHNASFMIDAYKRMLNALYQMKTGRDYLEKHPSAYKVWAKIVHRNSHD